MQSSGPTKGGTSHGDFILHHVVRRNSTFVPASLWPSRPINPRVSKKNKFLKNLISLYIAYGIDKMRMGVLTSAVLRSHCLSPPLQLIYIFVQNGYLTIEQSNPLLF